MWIGTGDGNVYIYHIRANPGNSPHNSESYQVRKEQARKNRILRVTKSKKTQDNTGTSGSKSPQKHRNHLKKDTTEGSCENIPDEYSTQTDGKVLSPRKLRKQKRVNRKSESGNESPCTPAPVTIGVNENEATERKTPSRKGKTLPAIPSSTRRRLSLQEGIDGIEATDQNNDEQRVSRSPNKSTSSKKSTRRKSGSAEDIDKGSSSGSRTSSPIPLSVTERLRNLHRGSLPMLDKVGVVGNSGNNQTSLQDLNMDHSPHRMSQLQVQYSV